MASTYATFTPGTSTNNNKFTMSVWVKRTKITGDYQAIYVSHISGGGGAGLGLFIGNDNSVWYNSGTSSSAFQNTSTSAKLRDLSGWYHIVVAGDTTQSGTDKLKIWINNELQTSFGNDNRSSFAGLSYDLGSATYANQLGRKHDGTYYLEGVLSHFHFIDGTTYTPSTFGSTDSTTGEWKINTAPSVTYGNNGFFLFKDDNSLNDDSGEGNNFTLGAGTLTKTEDNPSNVFCTLNPLQKAETGMSVTYSFGNTKYAGNSSNWQRAYGTIGANTGKFFYEFKVLNVSGTSDQLRVGWDSISSINDGTDNYYSGLTIDTAGKLRGGQDGYSGYDPNAVQMTAISGGNFSFTTGDILGMAIDIDNNTFSVYKNGTLEINAYSYASASNCSLLKSKGHFIGPSVNWYSTSGEANRSCFNFGNGYFETTAISSAGTNASGIGLFEYDVPANYTAFSTKGLNE